VFASHGLFAGRQAGRWTAKTSGNDEEPITGTRMIAESGATADMYKDS